MKNNYIETFIQKGFTPGMPVMFDYTAHPAYFFCQAKRNEKSLVVTLLDLRDAFDLVHHNLITVVLGHNHIPDIIEANISVYKEFASTIATDLFTTSFLQIKKGVLLDHSFNPLITNILVSISRQCCSSY